jgi:ribosomal protein S18 acetylase RimI-like enzyme
VPSRAPASRFDVPTASLRDAHPHELDAIGAMMVAAYAEFMPPTPVPEWRAYEDEIRDVRRRLPDATLIVAEDVGRLLGAVTYYPDATKETNTRWPPSWAVFRLLAVHPDARGRGIGRRLTEECIRRACATGREAIGLHTTQLMNVARAMYERIGFVRVPELDFLPMPTFRVMAYRLTLSR